MDRPIVCLHMSDLHFGPNGRFSELDPVEIASRFAVAISAARDAGGVPDHIDLLIVTGDISEAALPRQFETAHHG